MTRWYGFHIGFVLGAVSGCSASADSIGTASAEVTPAVWKDDLGSDSASAELARQYPLVFVSNRSGTSRLDLYLMSPDGRGRDAILVSAGEDHFFPKWAPNGFSILTRRLAAGVSAEVGLIAPDGSQLVFLTAGEGSSAYGYAPNWSVDGDLVSFGSIRSEGTHVWVVSRFGGTPVRLLPSVAEEHREAVWSPDGSRLAYSAQIGDGRRRDLFITDSKDRIAADNLTRGRVYAPGFLRWSPDGSRIAFASGTVSADGSPVPGDPSADGAYIAPDNEIFVIDVDSTELTQLTDNGKIDIAPTWSPDGSSLVFTSDRDGDSDLWMVTLGADDEPRNLIDDADEPHEDSLADWYWGTTP